MEHRIGINNRRKQFTGIGRDYLCDFQDGVQYQFPYPVRSGQLESTGSGFTEECSDGLVCLKPPFIGICYPDVGNGGYAIRKKITWGQF